MNITTKFINNTTLTLTNPFTNLPTSNNLPNYISALTTALCHYAPSIKQNVNIAIDGDDIAITVTFS